jgi:thymidylate kinase
MPIDKEYFLSNLFASLSNANIDYFVIGEYKTLPESTGDSDLDIIVTQTDSERFLSILNDLIVQNKLIVASYYINNNGYFYRILSTQKSFWGLQLDLFYKGFYYQNQEYFPVEEIKDDILLYKGVNVLDLKKAYLIGFLKEIVHKAWSKDKYIKGFVKEVSRDKEKYKLLFLHLYGKEFVEIVFANLAEKRIKDNSAKLGQIVFKKIHKGRFSKIKNILDKASYLKRVFNKPGYAIAFLGADGSGKSTIIDAVSPILNEAFHNSVYYEHLRPNKFPSIAKIMGKKEGFEVPVTDPHSKKPSGVFGSLLRWTYYLLDYTIGYGLKVFPKKAFKSCVWIFDRYYYDYRIDKRRTRVNLPGWVLHFGQFLIPEPDLIICLGAEPEAIHSRKPELPFEEVKRQVNVLSKFCHENKRAVWVDTGQSIEQSVNDTMIAISNKLGKRFDSIPRQNKA